VSDGLSIEVPGVRVGNESITSVPAEAHIRPLRDNIVIEPLDWRPSSTIQVVYNGKPLRGKVRAVGPGRYPKKYDGPKGKRSKTWDSTHFRATEVKVGDVVELGGLEIRGYLFQTVRWGSKEVIVCSEQDIAIVYD
jgi:co-chaperonin GroES (HSP10)